MKKKYTEKDIILFEILIFNNIKYNKKIRLRKVFSLKRKKKKKKLLNSDFINSDFINRDFINKGFVYKEFPTRHLKYYDNFVIPINLYKDPENNNEARVWWETLKPRCVECYVSYLPDNYENTETTEQLIKKINKHFFYIKNEGKYRLWLFSIKDKKYSHPKFANLKELEKRGRLASLIEPKESQLKVCIVDFNLDGLDLDKLKNRHKFCRRLNRS